MYYFFSLYESRCTVEIYELWQPYEGQVDFLLDYHLKNLITLKEEVNGPNHQIKTMKFEFGNADENAYRWIELKCHYHNARGRDCLIKSTIVSSSDVITIEKDPINKLLFEFLDENYF